MDPGGGIFVSTLFFVKTEQHIVQVTRTEVAWGRPTDLTASCAKLRGYLQNFAGKVPGLMLDLRANPLPPADADLSNAFRRFMQWLASSFMRTAVVVRRGAEKDLHQRYAQADAMSLHVFLNEAFARAYLGA